MIRRWMCGLCLIFAASLAQAQDAMDVAKALFLESVRQSPALADDPAAQLFALRSFVEPDARINLNALSSEERDATLKKARDWIVASSSGAAALPLEAEIAFPGSIRINQDGTLQLAGGLGKKQPIYNGTLDQILVRAPGQTPPVTIRPLQPFNLTSMQPPDAVRARLTELAEKRSGVMVVTRLRIDDLNYRSPSNAVAGGRVLSVALHELAAVDRKLTKGALIWQAPDAAPKAQPVTPADLHRAFRLQKVDGRYIDRDGAAQSGLIQLLGWKALSDLPIDEVLARRLSPDLFWFAYNQIAPRSLQDSLIPPHKLDNNRKRIEANEIEQRALEDAALRTLLPQIAAAMPEGPLPITSTARAPMQAYDFNAQRFPVAFRATGWLLGGRYPILTGLPDQLSVAKAQAETLLQRLDQIDGPGRRFLTVLGRYDLSVKSATFAPDEPLRLPQVVPAFALEHASIHAGANHPSLDTLPPNKLMDLDPARFRGPEQPVADKAELAAWAARADHKGSRGEDLIAAALSVAADPDALAAAMNRQGRVGDPLATAQGLTLPDPLMLTGQMSFVERNGRWSAQDFRYGYWTNESGLDAPQVELAETSFVSNIDLTEAQAEAMRATRGRLSYLAKVTPVTADVRGARSVVFLRIEEIALFSAQKGETGLPVFRAILTAPAQAAAPKTVETPADAPQMVVLDHDYLDLLHVREAGDALDEATLDRMLLDRLLRELRTPEADLTWGRFFDPAPQRLNRVERAQMLPGFLAWQEARARALPDQVLIRVATNPIQAGCGVLTYAAPQQVNQFSPGVKAKLEELSYEAVSKSVGATLGVLEKAAREHPERAPMLADTRLAQIGGRPVYEAYRLARHPSAGACLGSNVRLDPVTDGFDPKSSSLMDAVVVLRSPVLLPQERRQVVETRHLARPVQVTLAPSSRADGPKSAGTLTLEFEVTDSIFYGQNALPSRHVPKPSGKPIRISVDQVRALSVPPPAVTDITGLTLDMSREDMGVMLIANGADQTDLSHEYQRQISQIGIPGHGALPGTEAYTGAMMRIDRGAEEMMLALSDDRTGAAHVALGRLKLFDPAKVSAEGVLGALLKKYGDPSFAKDDRRGGAPLKRLVWGFNPKISLPHCLPDLNGTAARTIRDAFPINSDTDRENFALAQQFAMPVFPPFAESLPDYSQCGTVFIAEVSARKGKLSLVTWVVDPSALADIDWSPEAAKSTDALKEDAADIDL